MRNLKPYILSPEPQTVWYAGHNLPPDPVILALKHHLLECENKFKVGQFSVAVRELVSQYMALEEFYLEETANMAVRIDQVVRGEGRGGEGGPLWGGH